MNWEAERDIWEPWAEQTLAWVDAINSYVETGREQGWDVAGEEPPDPRSPELAERVVDLVLRANAEHDWNALRKRVPTAHRPFIPWMERGGRNTTNVSWIDDERVVASLGDPWEGLEVHVFSMAGEDELLEGVQLVGRTGTAFALVRGSEIELRTSWGEPGIRVPMPIGSEGIPNAAEPWDGGYPITVAPFPDASGAVIATSQGVFLSEPSGVRRLHPDAEAIAADIGVHEEYHGTEPYSARFDMTHAAISPDGERIAVGSQDSQHVILDRQGERVGAFGPVYSSYPHHATFHPSSQAAFFNSCHFYNGVTVGVLREHFEGMALDRYEEHEHMLTVDPAARVYDSTWLGKALLLGDASGYVRVVGFGNRDDATHFVGSSIGGMDVSPSGRFLAVGTAAGFLSLIDTQAEAPDPAVIGTSGFAEVRRFVAWKPSILRW